MNLQNVDPDIYKALEGEKKRQKQGMELIPSENYVSEAVLTAMGSIFTNKYSEGYPGKRYYGGQTYTDQIENIAIERAKEIFGCDHANVQPLSGANANIAAYFAWLEPGDTVIGMDLSHGGHLTHGHPVTHIAKIFNFHRYGIKNLETGEINYEQMYDLAKKHNPNIILAGFSAYPREYDYEKMKEIADEVGAIAMADVAHISGLIAGGALKNPFDAGFHMVTTTTHKSLRGPRGAMILTKGKVGNPLKKTEKKIENLPTLVDRAVFPGLQGGPHMNKVAAIAVALKEASQNSYKDYAKQVIKNAKALADKLMEKDAKLVTNGTDNHLMLVDCESSWGINGKVMEEALDKVGITLNKNAIPDDPNPYYKPSGIRLGTPAMTTRGMKEEEMEQIGEWIIKVAKHHNDDKELEKLHKEVINLCEQYPVPAIN
jgi:glycine hydroxymethyltransferase